MLKNLMLVVLVGLSYSEVHSQNLDELANEVRIKIELIQSNTSALIQGEQVYCIKSITEVYNSRAFEPIWNEQLALQLFEILLSAEQDGLIPTHYHSDLIEQLIKSIALNNFQQADLELLLTDAFLLYTSHLLSGKVNPVLIDSEWKAVKSEADPVKFLNHMMATQDVKNVLDTAQPMFKAYGRLKQQLAFYREIAKNGGWKNIPSGETLKLDMKARRVHLIRERLEITGDLQPYTFDEEELYDSELSRSVLAFQKRHGLDPDGNVGKETLAALNVPVATRIDQIILNMERCRWLPQDLGKRYIMVNLPAFDLQVVTDQVVSMEMSVVCGKPVRQTPVFSSTMTYLVFNPYWTVPPTILTQDMIPAQAKNPDYLKNLNIKVLKPNGEEVSPDSIKWSSINGKNFPYILRQEPGTNNALGMVKFIFPNPYNIYLHDTNHREVFVKNERALSSGCIRVAHPIALANFLLSFEKGWNEARVEEVIKDKQNYSVILKEPIQVHLQYWTAFVSENGTLNFRKDIYSRDEKVLKELKKSAPRS